MKIIQLCSVDFVLAHFLLPVMTAMRKEDHDVIGVCADGPLLGRVRDLGFRVETVPLHRSANPLRALRTVVALVPLLRREQPDILHVHTPVAALLGRLASLFVNVGRVVYTAHGFYFHERMPWHQRAAHVTLEWLLGRATDTLFAQSEEDAAAARRLRLCRTGDILAIGNGSDPARFRPDADGGRRAGMRMTLGTAPARPVVIFVGRLVAEKGVPELIRAMHHVDADLWLVGERLASDHAGDMSAALAAAASDPELKARVRTLGYRDDIPDLLCAADIFTLPSHREGMPRSIIEAMLAGLPVVATDIRGSREEVIAGETGALVPVGDADALAAELNRLVGDPGLRRRQGAAGLSRARRLYDEKVVIARQMRHLGLRRPEPVRSRIGPSGRPWAPGNPRP